MFCGSTECVRTTLLAITPWFLGLGLLLGGCTTVEKGVVVGKGSRVDSSTFPRVENYWVDVRGLDGNGVKVTDRVLLFKKDWEKIGKGDRFAPADYGVMDLPATFRKLAKGGMPGSKKPTPAPDNRPAPPRKVTSTAAEPRPAKKAAPKPAAPTEADFRAVEARANEDAAVREAKRKIHSAATPEEQSRAWEEYRSKLLQKMRELAPALRERIDRAEVGGSAN